MLSQQILDVAETQGESDIKPDRLLDDFGREAIFRISAEFGVGLNFALKLLDDGRPFLI
jgi:hypothetical protein